MIHRSMFRHHSTFIPRQRLLFAYVYKNNVNLYSYNCSRDIVEKLNKQIDNIGHWFNARSALSMSIVAQKLGLFNHQPFYRKQKKSRGKNANPFMGNYHSLNIKYYCRELLIWGPFKVETRHCEKATKFEKNLLTCMMVTQ